MKYGDMAERTYKTKGVAIREAKKHLYFCACCERVYAEVWEVDMETHTRQLIWEGEN